MSDQIPFSLCMFFIILHIVLSLIFPLVISNINEADEEENFAYGQSTVKFTVEQLLFIMFGCILRVSADRKNSL